MTPNQTKERKIGIRLAIAVSLAALLIGVGTTEGLRLSGDQGTRAALAQAQAADSQPAPAAKGIIDFAPLAKKLKPVVVNVSTTQVTEGAQGSPSPFGENDPFNEFWRRFYGNPGRSRQQSLGSGVIIESDGYILTNNHVIDNAEKITVKLSDGREFSAKVVGKDPKTDIALVKIDTRDLPTASLGDSDRLDVGEWVLAIGNPFGLDNTVTSGIVSAKERHIGNGPYDSFIQTDASINPGNSGGPLINMRGEVIGINTAIFSQSGGNIGIGFAIPANLVKEILPQLKGSGKVTRGWLGVVIQPVTPALAESLGLDKSAGALVSDLAKGGPAERAGIKVGDLVTEYDGKEIKSANDLPILVARTAPQKQVRLKVLRDKKEITIPITLGELKDQEIVASAKETGTLGLTVQKVTPEIAESLGLKRAEGVVVTSVEPGSVAEDAGMQQGDLIVEVNRKPIRDVSDYRKATAETQKGKGTLLLVRRGENTMFLALKP